MNEEYIKDIIKKLKEGLISETEAYEALKELPYKEMGFANLDNHRQIRTGFPEIVYCERKTCEQVGEIFFELAKHGTVLGTRASENDYLYVKKKVANAIYHSKARIIEVNREANQSNTANPQAKLTVVSAGTADIPVAEEAAVTAEVLGMNVNRVYDVGVAGIHRLIDKLDVIRAADIVIVVAGMEGALGSVVGGLVDAPVIAVPTSVGYGSNFEGLSALLSMLNSCANGLSVVNIDNGFGAGYMAALIGRKITK